MITLYLAIDVCVRGRASEFGLRDGLSGDGADKDRARAMVNRGPNRWTGPGTGDDGLGYRASSGR
jgi:hypothetical protein